MQEEPRKTDGNYNEYHGARRSMPLPKGVVKVEYSSKKSALEQQEILKSAIRMVNIKIDEILGSGNELTGGDLVYPKVRFVETDPDHPDYAGYFQSHLNHITIVNDKIADDSLSQTKVLIHEYIHYLCHNGRDDSEQLSEHSPIAERNNVGFRRDFGLDIRDGKEGETTSDYFMSFNEAITEQLAIDILPGVHETYSDYRGLLQQVIDDVVTRGLGSKDADGVFHAWSAEQVKHYMYRCFFRGDLSGFTRLLQMTYEKYDTSEQQFGLMTHKDDLPSVVEKDWAEKFPGSPPPPPSTVALVVQSRLNAKTPADYMTDIVGHGHGDGDGGAHYSVEYDDAIQDIKPQAKQTIEGIEYDIDTVGYIIYTGSRSLEILTQAKALLDKLLAESGEKNIDVANVEHQVDELLFGQYRMSMLSEGFREFYVYKHMKIDS